MEELEPLAVLMEIEREDGHRILQLTELGIIGKVGFNSKGIGVCLNILVGKQSPVAVPIHVLIRAALDEDDLEKVYNRYNQLEHGTYSNILMANDQGNRPFYEKYGFTYVGSELRQRLFNVKTGGTNRSGLLREEPRVLGANPQYP